MTTSEKPRRLIKGYTNEALADKIDSEGGIDYSFNHYFGEADIVDKELKQLVRLYVGASRRLEEFLTKHGALL